ncbi:Acetyl-coenzyme A synthetase OS=Tsukamurella paurometabola (strain ATCC 8368 / DSM / CCUG 35730/ CIP 100753 / JCM 10117 / KCTC 9821 / NBRC 16120 / NCIMB 702349 / NCTC 13040) OX=521096 GN=acsA PE=3 SV=1 [Tsukamurella paurometabola]|uniref:Acetyl-coenzyme A synthetase n=1 Tax=Tsukamurella paurometabola (strain ATCC 8368 / DSM 20162 / CCUG 35730 / CIP 100753 / JCM 10117 / KCTC 9821 / NBRC 16120 / NCIMB 702349 / NCTC 13040) TaxID=521096 RepID=D5UML4_TSUPD|nr:acetate--CoA ligase [Tsukamurella paurometabola]ADG80488.1 acetate/CoA ligase [Tsukamurella paurometabola DSM 20162]SUP39832.1 Acetyl-coenzyme A synthetase [Tsukamurella paurometabola]
MTDSATSAYPPSADFAAQANTHGRELYDRAEADRLGFWAEQANRLDWDTPFGEVLDWSGAPFAKWFVGGKLNVAYNCVDRHVIAGNGDRVAIHWVGEPGDTRDITYADLQAEVSRAANYLSSLGLNAGDRIAIYMPMVPEAIVAMLACARLGLTHSVVFGGFSAGALRSRIDDAQAKVVITTDGQFRRGKPAPLKANVDEALDMDVDGAKATSVEKVIVVQRCTNDIDWHDRDVWWHESVGAASPEHTPEAFDAEHPLFLLYTSGTTGKPKGIVHSSGGYLTQAAYTHYYLFDLKPEKDVYWCTADIGWVTGHTYIVYGPLANGATQIVYEGTPNSPTEHRHFEIIEKYGVSIYYIAPTLVRTFMKWGREIPDAHDLRSIRVLGSVGEPINPEAWRWYREVIGAGTAPIVDTWWQTETGAAMVAPLPGTTTLKPGSAMEPVPGISANIVDDDGNSLPRGESGLLVLDEPWPAMLRGIWGDPERFVDTYWSRYADQGWYFAGDGARYDEDGALWVLGRVDDVMNISGHRISTAEVESALVGHPAVAEAAVVGASDATTGQAIAAFVILRQGVDDSDPDRLITEMTAQVSKDISPIAKPREINIVPELPKTRSGKIMRRLLRDVAEGRELGDTSTLVDPTVFENIRKRKS